MTYKVLIHCPLQQGLKHTELESTDIIPASSYSLSITTRIETIGTATEYAAAVECSYSLSITTRIETTFDIISTMANLCSYSLSITTRIETTFDIISTMANLLFLFIVHYNKD